MAEVVQDNGVGVGWSAATRADGGAGGGGAGGQQRRGAHRYGLCARTPPQITVASRYFLSGSNLEISDANPPRLRDWM